MRRVSGRNDDMLIIRGVNVFPSQVESVLMRTDGVSPFYQIEVFREGAKDSLTVNVEITAAAAAEGDEARERIVAKVGKDIRDFVGLSVNLSLKDPGEVPRSAGKAVRVIDHRKRDGA